ncbi:efflux RND transporter periplasmic adaptor subunit [Marivirga salinae]|uniref:Efflux RND transporter periplasmic adaptor subunit n=1 Tax=Marivirga salinarum TaxID=3059078 RepID=A0AA51RC88_9BACT|nr:efflux RND transporter periplasmic adaptor subunit [Marivirga sp. BDSF4-3]WMN11418.1 efflux RND transporter periplasmic adaptor subunit [Marivirga sp. BDSF4-3]
MSKKLFLLLIPILSWACGSEEKIDEETATENVKNTAPNTMVKVDTVVSAPFYLLIESAGKVKAHKDVKVLAETTGTIQQANIKSGQKVSAGEVLIRLNPEEAQLKLQSAEINYEKAKLEFENSLIGFPKLLAQENPEQDSLYQKLKIGSGMQESSIQLQEAKIALQKTVIRVPFSGTLYDVKAFKGKHITSGDELFSEFNHRLLVEVNLLESEALNLKEDMPAEIRNPAKDTSFQGEVFSINPKVDENGLVQTHILIKGEHALWPGMNVYVEIKIPKGERLQVPKSSLVLRSGKPVVFSIEKDLAKWNYVEFGYDNGKMVEITDGLKAGMLVITNNNLQLAHDAPISIQNSDN